MKQVFFVLAAVSSAVLMCCGERLKEKGFEVRRDDTTGADAADTSGAVFSTRPSNVLLTGNPAVRLTTVYKVNYNKDGTSFIGSNDFYYGYDGSETEENAWHGNYLPGLQAAYGYNMVNVSHFNIQTQKQIKFFSQPVLIKTLYYPSFSKDTLNSKPVTRNYFMTSVYDEDTNKDGSIDAGDLRRFYYFDVDVTKRALIPLNYSVYKSEYDSANDFLYVFARLDENNNGQVDDGEADHIFWIDLGNPGRTGRQY